MEFLGFSPVFDIYEELSTLKSYEIFMKDVKNFVSPYHHLENPLKLFKEYISVAGFRAKHLELREQIYIYKNTDHLKSIQSKIVLEQFLILISYLDAVLSTNPFTSRMPVNLRERFINDYFALLERFTENKFIDESSEIIYRYKIIVAVLTK